MFHVTILCAASSSGVIPAQLVRAARGLAIYDIYQVKILQGLKLTYGHIEFSTVGNKKAGLRIHSTSIKNWVLCTKKLQHVQDKYWSHLKNMDPMVHGIIVIFL